MIVRQTSPALQSFDVRFCSYVYLFLSNLYTDGMKYYCICSTADIKLMCIILL